MPSPSQLGHSRALTPEDESQPGSGKGHFFFFKRAAKGL